MIGQFFFDIVSFDGNIEYRHRSIIFDEIRVSDGDVFLNRYSIFNSILRYFTVLYGGRGRAAVLRDVDKGNY